MDGVIWHIVNMNEWEARINGKLCNVRWSSFCKLYFIHVDGQVVGGLVDEVRAKECALQKAIEVV